MCFGVGQWQNIIDLAVGMAVVDLADDVSKIGVRSEVLGKREVNLVNARVWRMRCFLVHR